jgi:cytochrome c-type protein NapB
MKKQQSGYFIIVICSLLLLSAVFIFFAALRESKRPAETLDQPAGETAALPLEAGVFRRWAMALKYKDMPEGGRNLAAYYANRAYYGAPPRIPHPLVSEQGIGGKTCLQCHENGGYTEQFKAFAPVAPHPDWHNCRQCHVPKKTEGLFAGSSFEKLQPPPLGQAAMPGSPPVMPHGLQNRENCLSCHAGPAAPAAIRTTHPERVNCRQCHVPAQTGGEAFERPGNELGSTWTRPSAPPMEKEGESASSENN